MKKAGSARLFSSWQTVEPQGLLVGLKHLTPRRLVIAVSGGLDSQVLLHLTWRLASSGGLPCPVEVWHVNHGLQAGANGWQAQVARLAAGYGFVYRAFCVAVLPTANVEAGARHARYAAFSAHANLGDVLLLGQHADDQSETLMLRLMRGSGPTGLSAMAEVRASDGVYWVRPMLHIERRQLEEYACQWQLEPIEDPSNASEVYDRNYLRHQVMPRLTQRWPSLNARLRRSIEACDEASSLLQELAELDMRQCDWLADDLSLALPAWAELSQSRQFNLLRCWFLTRGALPPPVSVKAKLSQFVEASDDRQPQLSWEGWQLRRYRQRLYFVPEWLENLSLPQSCVLQTRTPLPYGELIVSDVKGRGVRADPEACWEVRFRQGGESWQPSGATHKVSLKHYMQGRGIPPWERALIPLLYCDNELVAVATHPAQGWVAQADECGWWLTWQRELT